MKGIKTCPFCNHNARLWYASDGGYIIECDNEKCGCSYGNNMTFTSEEVINLWNDRKGNDTVKELEEVKNSIWVTEDLESEYDCGKRSAEVSFIEKLDTRIKRLKGE